ncbi:hypothetical protein GEMRC1_009122 [Eukaryota sp. GEM-RC1]
MEELKAEIAMYQKENSNLERTVEAKTSEISSLTDEKHHLASQIAELEHSLEEQKQDFLKRETDLKSILQKSVVESISEMTTLSEESVHTLKSDYLKKVSDFNRVIEGLKSQLVEKDNEMAQLEQKTVEAAQKLQLAAINLQSRSKSIVRDMIKQEQQSLEDRISELIAEREETYAIVQSQIYDAVNRSQGQTTIVANERDELLERQKQNERFIKRLKEAYLSLQDTILAFDSHCSDLMRILTKVNVFMAEIDRWGPKNPNSILQLALSLEGTKALMALKKVSHIKAIHFNRIDQSKVNNESGTPLYFTLTWNDQLFYTSETVPVSSGAVFKHLPIDKFLKRFRNDPPNTFKVTLFQKKSKGMSTDMEVYTETVVVPRLMKYEGQRSDPSQMPFIIVFVIDGNEYWNPPTSLRPVIPKFPDTLTIDESVYNDRPKFSLVSVEVIEHESKIVPSTAVEDLEDSDKEVEEESMGESSDDSSDSDVDWRLDDVSDDDKEIKSESDCIETKDDHEGEVVKNEVHDSDSEVKVESPEINEVKTEKEEDLQVKSTPEEVEEQIPVNLDTETKVTTEDVNTQNQEDLEVKTTTDEVTIERPEDESNTDGEKKNKDEES